jgi:prepilin peptidase CpaA
MNTVHIPAFVVLGATLIAAITDVRSFKVHNALTLPLLFSGLVYHGVMNGTPGFQSSVGGMLFAFVVLILPYLAGGMGAGDVKLLAGVGTWLGLPTVIYVFLAASIAAGLYALGLVLSQRRFRETLANLQIIWFRVQAIGKHLQDEDSVETQTSRDDRRKRLVPFAAMVAFGVIATFLWAWTGL